MSFYNALKQFKENRRLFGNPESQPEKYNLYAGLENLADGLQNLESTIDSLRKEIRNMRKE